MKHTVIFKLAASAGVVTTAVLTAKAVPYLIDYKEELIASLNFADSNEEKFDARKNFLINSAKVLMPAAATGLATVSLIFCLDREHKKIEKAYLASLALAKANLRKLEDETDRVLINFNPEKVKKAKVKPGEILVYEPYTDQIFPTTERIIEKAIEKAGRRLNQFYFQTLNRFLKDIGGEPCPFGDRLGWSCKNNIQMAKWQKEGPSLSISITPYEVEEREVFMLSYDVEPLWIEK